MNTCAICNNRREPLKFAVSYIPDEKLAFVERVCGLLIESRYGRDRVYEKLTRPDTISNADVINSSCRYRIQSQACGSVVPTCIRQAKDRRFYPNPQPQKPRDTSHLTARKRLTDLANSFSATS